MISTLDDVTTSLPVRKLFGIHDNVVIAIFSGTRRVSRWTVAKTTLAERVRPALSKMRPAVLLGLSADQPSTFHIPRALEESRLALDFATVAERVVQYSEIPVRQIMLRAIKQQGDVSLPAWVDKFVTADQKARGSLAATLRAYADTDMNFLQVAKALSVHPNLIYSRVQRIRDMTG